MGRPTGTSTHISSASYLANLVLQIVSPQANKPVMGIVQDTLCGIFKMTQRDVFIDWSMVQNLVLWVPGRDGVIPTPTEIKPKSLWSAKQKLSSIILPGIDLATSVPRIPVDDDTTLIENGELVIGICNTPTVGSSHGGLIHIIFRERGPDTTRDMIGGIQFIVHCWLFHNDSSIDIGDTGSGKPADKHVMLNIVIAKDDARRTIEEATSVDLKTIRESFEAIVNSTLVTSPASLRSRV